VEADITRASVIAMVDALDRLCGDVLETDGETALADD
jgi:D-citramalate synthase